MHYKYLLLLSRGRRACTVGNSFLSLDYCYCSLDTQTDMNPYTLTNVNPSY